MEKQIGWYNLREEKVFCNNGFECAAWYENIRVPAGKYPMVVYDYKLRPNGAVDGHVMSGYISMKGIVVSDEFGSRFCGMPIGNYDNHKNAGKESTYTMSPYLFSVADSIINDADSPYELLPEYEARESTYTSDYDGKMHTTHGIFVK